MSSIAYAFFKNNKMENTYNNNSKIVYINTFKNIKSPQVIDEIDTYTYLNNLTNIDAKTYDKIKEARYFYQQGEKEKYNKIKHKLPCYTLNFGFDKYKLNDNIIGSTGFIYIDVDNETNIDLNNELVFASWKSLSNNGRGILVKVEGLYLNNFQYNYNLIAGKLGVKADKGASKATQYTIQSYDENLYLNEDSITFKALEVNKKVPTSIPLKKENKDSTELGIKSSIRFNTISDYDFKSKPYLYFPEDKEAIAEIYIPRRIEKGDRNTKLYAIGMNIRGINPYINTKSIEGFIYSINLNHCKPPLKDNEVSSIIRSIMRVENPTPFYNKERRIIFNPDFKFSTTEKRTIINKLLGEKRRKKTYEELKECINNWDFEHYGKITIKKIAKVSKRNKKTVAKYYSKLRNDKTLITYFKKH